MSVLDTPPQFELFQLPPPLARQRGGIPRHMPTPETRLRVNQMKAAGHTQAAIAKALGIGVGTLAAHYYPSNEPRPRRGRRCHAPTPATRKIVRRAVEGGLKRPEIAKLIGISLPTLALHYRVELRREAE